MEPTGLIWPASVPVMWTFAYLQKIAVTMAVLWNFFPKFWLLKILLQPVNRAVSKLISSRACWPHLRRSTHHDWTRTVYYSLVAILPSVLWHCWLGVRKSIRPVKIERWGVDVLSLWSEVQIVYIWFSWCHCHPKTPSSLASFLSRLVLYLSGTGLPRMSWKGGN